MNMTKNTEMIIEVDYKKILKEGKLVKKLPIRKIFQEKRMKIHLGVILKMKQTVTNMIF